MGLLNPILLVLAGAVAVPLLLHLFQRHQGPRVIFPALRYLRRAEKESARKIKLRQLLLMLLRVAAVLLIAFAAARPFVRAGGVGHAPTAVVLVLDNSLSTAAVAGEERVLDVLKQRALEVLEEVGPDDRVWLLRAGVPDEPALTGDALETARRVRETEPAAASADLIAAVTHARSLLAAGADGRATEIHLLTDLQATSFRGTADAAGETPPVVVWHPGTDAPPNRSVGDIEVGGGLAPIAQQRTNVTATVLGDGEAAVNVRLHVDGRLIAAATAPPGATAVLGMPPRDAGPIAGHVEIDADALHADDLRYFAARVLPPPSVSTRGQLPFVEDALAVLASAGRVRRAGAGAADVAILPAAEGVEALGARSAAVILPPTNPVELPAVNRRLAAAGIPWRYQPPVAGEARFQSSVNDPLLRALAGARLQVVYPLRRDDQNASDSVLIRLDDGTAWAVSGARRVGGAYVMLGSPLTPEASTIPTSAAMLPVLDRLTGAWVLQQSAGTSTDAGAEVMLPSAAAAVVHPDGSRDDVAGAAPFRLPLMPGVYRVMRGDSLLTAYAVNAPAAESDLDRLDARELEQRLPGWTLHVTDDAGGWQRAVFRERLGNELWKPLLIAVLVVLLIETIVAAAGRTRRAATAPRAASEAETG